MDSGMKWIVFKVLVLFSFHCWAVEPNSPLTWEEQNIAELRDLEEHTTALRSRYLELSTKGIEAAVRTSQLALSIFDIRIKRTMDRAYDLEIQENEFSTCLQQSLGTIESSKIYDFEGQQLKRINDEDKICPVSRVKVAFWGNDYMVESRCSRFAFHRNEARIPPNCPSGSQAVVLRFRARGNLVDLSGFGTFFTVDCESEESEIDKKERIFTMSFCSSADLIALEKEEDFDPLSSFFSDPGLENVFIRNPTHSVWDNFQSFMDSVRPFFNGINFVERREEIFNLVIRDDSSPEHKFKVAVIANGLATYSAPSSSLSFHGDHIPEKRVMETLLQIADNPMFDRLDEAVKDVIIMRLIYDCAIMADTDKDSDGGICERSISFLKRKVNTFQGDQLVEKTRLVEGLERQRKSMLTLILEEGPIDRVTNNRNYMSSVRETQRRSETAIATLLEEIKEELKEKYYY